MFSSQIFLVTLMWGGDEVLFKRLLDEFWYVGGYLHEVYLPGAEAKVVEYILGVVH